MHACGNLERNTTNLSQNDKLMVLAGCSQTFKSMNIYLRMCAQD